MADPTATTTIPCPRCGIDISETAAIRRAVAAERARIRAAVEALDHRRCGPRHEGCYSHWSTPHCRADGMAWPCDVVAVLALLDPEPLADPGDHHIGVGK